MREDADPATVRLVAEEALALARSMEERDGPILRMARTYARLGYHREALDLAATVAPGKANSYALGNIAETLAEAGEIALARETASLGTGPAGVKQLLVRTLSVQIGRGDAAGAMRTFALLPASVDRESALRQATLGHHLDFQYRQWDSYIATALLDFADLVAEAGADPVTLRHCLLGDALAAGDLAIAARRLGRDRGRPLPAFDMENGRTVAPRSAPLPQPVVIRQLVRNLHCGYLFLIPKLHRNYTEPACVPPAESSPTAAVWPLAIAAGRR